MSPIDQHQEQRQRERLRRLVDRVTDEQLETSLGGDWTVGVALAHLAFWDRRVAAQLAKWEREGRGPEPRDQIDSAVINEASLAQWRALSPRAAATEALAAVEAADQALARADPRVIEQVIAQNGPFSLPRAVHRAEHLDQIERAIGT
ncbi:MAG: maleylpyruvate isomerase N-terminal domain-containing protein [Chloroflexota bacterium]|nr:maleylpyruvate isomerase N-terminal domain-containing protein [Chloroflexota bacterium]